MIGLGQALTLALAPQGAGGGGAEAPGDPQNVRVVGQSSDSLELSWDATPAGIAVKIEWKLPGSNWDTLISSDSELTTSYAISSGLSPDSAYDVRVRAENGDLTSDWVELTGQYTGGATPTLSYASAGAYGVLNVGWAVNDALSEVNIYLNGVLTGISISVYDGSCSFEGLSPLTPFYVTITGTGVNGGMEGTASAAYSSHAGAGSAPSNTAPPSISWDLALMWINLGSWSGDPDSFTFSYQWRLDSTPISGAVQDSYSPASGAGGSYDCIVTATNAAGSSSVTTDPNYIS